MFYIYSPTVLYAPFLAEWLGCWTADPEVLGSNPVKSKNNFASFMLTEIINLISKHDFDLELLERS